MNISRLMHFQTNIFTDLNYRKKILCPVVVTIKMNFNLFAFKASQRCQPTIL